MLRFSVIVPTYNRAFSILETLQSIFDQTRPADEIIVIDDGSTDDTAEVLAPVMDRIIYLRQDNAGVSAARNAGVARATGDWITFLDSDDIWSPDRLAILARDVADVGPEIGVHLADMEFEGVRSRHTLLATKTLEAPAGSAVPLSDPFIAMVSGGSLMAVAVRSESVLAVGGFLPEFRVRGDTVFLARIALTTRWIVTGDRVALTRRFADDPVALKTTTESDLSRALQIKGLEHLLDCVTEPHHRRIVARRLSHAWFTLANRRLDERQDGVRPALLQSLRTHPSWWRGVLRIAPPFLFGRLAMRRGPSPYSR